MNEIPTYATFVYLHPDRDHAEVEVVGISGENITGTLAVLNIPRAEYSQMDQESLDQVIATALLAQSPVDSK